MAFANVEEVVRLIDLIEDPTCPLKANDLDDLGIDLPQLRRPRWPSDFLSKESAAT